MRVFLEVINLQPGCNGSAEDVAQGMDEPVGRRRLLLDFAFVDDRLILHERFLAKVRGTQGKGIG
ncbi:hypothetical protein D3C87_1922520 [compost metagenome]